MVGGLGEGGVDVDALVDPVDVVPVEGEEFGQAQAGPVGELDEVFELTGGGVDDGLAFVVVEGLDGVGFVGGGAAAFAVTDDFAGHGVVGDEVLFDGFVEGSAQEAEFVVLGFGGPLLAADPVADGWPGELVEGDVA